MKFARLLVPTASVADLWRMARIALTGALVAGLFGIVHDQITFSISPEYFTRMKFDQFRHADFGLPVRVWVAEIGFLATWWVGLIGGWFLARIVVPKQPAAIAWRRMGVAFGWMVFATIAGCGFGGWLGPRVLSDVGEWNESLQAMAVVDVTAFNRVAGIHTGGYLGALISWLVLMAQGLRDGRKSDHSGA